MRILILSLAISSLLSPPPAEWHWPVRDSPGVIRHFQAPLTPWGPGHRGIDLSATVGSAVLAPDSGRIYFSGDVAGRGVITIETAEGWLISMEPLVPEISRGAVRKGQRLGVVAQGHCESGCLHIGLRVEGEYRSPARELGVLERAVLLPIP